MDYYAEAHNLWLYAVHLFQSHGKRAWHRHPNKDLLL